MLKQILSNIPIVTLVLVIITHIVAMFTDCALITIVVYALQEPISAAIRIAPIILLVLIGRVKIIPSLRPIV